MLPRRAARERSMVRPAAPKRRPVFTAAYLEEEDEYVSALCLPCLMMWQCAVPLHAFCTYVLMLMCDSRWRRIVGSSLRDANASALATLPACIQLRMVRVVLRDLAAV
jgi:hypothetical protein